METEGGADIFVSRNGEAFVLASQKTTTRFDRYRIVY